MNQPTKMGKTKLLTFIALHILILFNSLSGVFSKMAGKAKFLSFDFCLYYGLVLAIMFVYAIAWQQVLKRIPLTTAFCNKAVNFIWAMLWGVLIFKETPGVNMLIGAPLVIIGVILVVTDDEH